MNSVAAIVPSWNTAHYLGRCLNSLEMQDGIDIELMVIDNGSEDASVDLLRQRGVPHVALPLNTGFAAAVNLGVVRTTAPLILVLNADCFLEPGCVQVLLGRMQADPHLAGVQPRILQERGPGGVMRIYSAGQCLSRHGAAFELGWGDPDGPESAVGKEVFGVCGAACLLRRDVFTELGGYDEHYFAFYEDVDFNARARLSGWSFFCAGEAAAVHVGHVAWRQVDNSHSFNVELTVRNRLATAVKVLPTRGVAACVLMSLRSLAASPFRGTSVAATKGIATALSWLPRLVSERIRLRAGSSRALDEWLARRQGPGRDPRDPSGAGP
jgi:GT2 family glycosyltransferase